MLGPCSAAMWRPCIWKRSKQTSILMPWPQMMWWWAFSKMAYTSTACALMSVMALDYQWPSNRHLEETCSIRLMLKASYHHISSHVRKFVAVASLFYIKRHAAAEGIDTRTVCFSNREDKYLLIKSKARRRIYIVLHPCVCNCDPSFKHGRYICRCGNVISEHWCWVEC